MRGQDRRAEYHEGQTAIEIVEAAARLEGNPVKGPGLSLRDATACGMRLVKERIAKVGVVERPDGTYAVELYRAIAGPSESFGLEGTCYEILGRIIGFVFYPEE